MDLVEVLSSQGSDVIVRRLRHRNADPTMQLTVLAVSEHAPSDGSKKLIREYEFSDYLDRAWALRPLEIVHETGQVILILEDSGGRLLSRLLETRKEIDAFLRMAIGITSAVSKMHQR